MVIFYSYVNVYQRVLQVHHHKSYPSSISLSFIIFMVKSSSLPHVSPLGRSRVDFYPCFTTQLLAQKGTRKTHNQNFNKPRSIVGTLIASNFVLSHHRFHIPLKWYFPYLTGIWLDIQYFQCFKVDPWLSHWVLRVQQTLPIFQMPCKKMTDSLLVTVDIPIPKDYS